MYKTNAKRKSHMVKNHPDCVLPAKPGDKVRSSFRSVDYFTSSIFSRQWRPQELNLNRK